MDRTREGVVRDIVLAPFAEENNNFAGNSNTHIWSWLCLCFLKRKIAKRLRFSSLFLRFAVGCASLEGDV